MGIDYCPTANSIENGL